eukprot:m.25753 g.25753  ORF g.25753 m.25753 type:complete len:66 (+) comp8759_c1_seq1:109-306(+)
MYVFNPTNKATHRLLSCVFYSVVCYNKVHIPTLVTVIVNFLPFQQRLTDGFLFCDLFYFRSPFCC